MESKKVHTLNIREERLKANGKCCGGNGPKCGCSSKKQKQGESTFMNHFNEIFNRR
tara:strand:+ start:179 stop:346 length:168 start_codon:yes stop_codon:yes gene_type:complete